MEYRVNRRTGDRISEIGMGTSYIHEGGSRNAVEAVRRAYEGGINYFDLASGHGKAFPIFGEALHDVRDDVLFQIHFGTDYSRGEYGWTLEKDVIEKEIGRRLRELGTDHIDYGFIHCQDTVSDWERYKENGVLDYIMELRKDGTISHLGMSSHTPSVIQRIMDDVEIDMLMFSINPAYDYGHGDYAHGGVDERAKVYRRCEKDGVGISVMKPFSGGQLLNASLSPFGVALTQYQCIRYALDRPGVLTVLPGARNVSEVEALLAYYDQSEEDTDYSVIGSFKPVDAMGKCVYCNHCQPCPNGIDVGLVNKYYDLALAGDGMAVQHYLKLDVSAEECTQCGHCDSRCPFGVKQSERMIAIADHFDSRKG